ncbi:MAG: isoprenylcysteine carboxyl methyltransferase [Acidobacteria bacterium]|nr:MAG: isoprenylcysteine carboxyl methyltransferase [Acidobacteriota bacterium]
MKRLSAIVGSGFFLLLAPGTVAGLVPWWITRWRMQPPLLGFSGFRLIGGLMIAAGIAVVLDSFARFALQGVGTPAPVLPTRHLVVSGLYQYVRNPMYVGVLWVLLGQVLLLGDGRLLAYGLLLWLGFHVFIVGYEEPTLRRSFGTEYEAFRRNVPRWIPRLSPWRGGGNET